MTWIKVRPKMALKEEGLFIIVKGKSAVMSPVDTSNTILLSEVV